MIIDILNNIASDNSRLHKEDVLKFNRDDATLREVFRAAYDPYTNYWIKKIPEYESRKTADGIDMDTALGMLSYLRDRVVTGNAAIEHLREILTETHPDDAEIIGRILQHDLRCGVSEATINKIWPGLIPSFSCMLCESANEKTIKNIKWPAVAQIKFDGMRVIAICKDGGVELRSRNGKEVQVHGVFDSYLNSMTNGKNVIFDGELLVLSDDGVLDRRTGNGIGTKAIKGTISQEEANRLQFVIWDVVPFEEFQSGESKDGYTDRYEDLCDRSKHLNTNKIDIAKIYSVNSIEDAQALFDEMYAKGFEGIILKDANSKWEDRRSKYQLKFKAELDADLLVVAWVEGEGKYAGKLGSVICKTSDDKLIVNVGSGFNDKDREMTPDQIVGKIITVKYNEKIGNKSNDSISLFLPRFICIREDKDVANSIKEIK